MTEHFQKQYGSKNVAGCHIAYNLKKFYEMAETKDDLENLLNRFKKLAQQTGQRIFIRKNWWSLSADTDAITYYENKLKNHIERMHHYLNKVGVQCLGVVFVSFTNIATAKKCLWDYHKFGKRSDRTLHIIDNKKVVLTASKAPEKDDIIWSNLGYGNVNRGIRCVCVNIINCFLLGIAVVALLYISVIGLSASWLAVTLSQILGSDIPLTVAEFIAYVVPIMVALQNSIVAWIMKRNTLYISNRFLVVTNWEKHHSKSAFNVSYFTKTIFFMFINTIIFPNLAYSIYNVGFPASDFFFSTAGVKALQLFISQALISKGMILIADFLELMFLFLKRGGVMKRKRFNLVSAYSINVTMFGVMLLFGGCSPLTWVFGKYDISTNDSKDFVILCLLILWISGE